MDQATTSQPPAAHEEAEASDSTDGDDHGTATGESSAGAERRADWDFADGEDPASGGGGWSAAAGRAAARARRDRGSGTGSAAGTNGARDSRGGGSARDGEDRGETGRDPESVTDEPDGPVGGKDVHERARQGVEHLQAAARELIEAARAALDVAEDMVNDPDALASLASMVAGLGDMARRVAGGGWPPSGTREPEPEDERQAKVERIRVT
jgi:hypothetical protein